MYDLCVRSKLGWDKDRMNALIRAYELNWSFIAWTTTTTKKLNGSNNISVIPKLNLTPSQISSAIQARNLASPSSLSSSSSSSSSSSLSIPDIKQYSRITVSIDDAIDAQSLTAGNTILKEFDIVAARTSNGKVFTHLCRQAEIDIISLDFSHPVNFPFDKKVIDDAISRGIYFEICYSPLLGGGNSNTTRRQVISNTRVLLQYLRSFFCFF